MIAIASGTRADWGLLMPLARTLRASGCEVSVIATYMHLMKDMGHTVDEITADGFGPAACVDTPRRPAEATGAATAGFAKVLRAMNPSCLIILGDRFEMLGAATAALLEQVPVVHIAGGTVSEGAFDDSIRNAISQLASLHLPETELCAQRLVRMGIDKSRIAVCGAIGVWNALNTPLLSLQALQQDIDFNLGPRFILGTLHPATLDTIPPEEQMRVWLEALERTIDNHPGVNVLLTYPNTDTDPAPLRKMLHAFESRRPDRVKVIDSLGRVRYLSAGTLVAAVFGYSSSGIVEVPSTGTPVVDIGMRQQGRERSKAVIWSPLTVEAITESLTKALNQKSARRASGTPNPYHRPATPQLMADAILRFINFQCSMFNVQL